jgi:hypothetical protein
LKKLKKGTKQHADTEGGFGVTFNDIYWGG